RHYAASHMVRHGEDAGLLGGRRLSRRRLARRCRVRRGRRRLVRRGWVLGHGGAAEEQRGQGYGKQHGCTFHCRSLLLLLRSWIASRVGCASRIPDLDVLTVRLSRKSK